MESRCFIVVHEESLDKNDWISEVIGYYLFV